MNQQARDLFGALSRAILLAAGILVLLWFLHRITGVLLFFTLALVLALALNAPVTWLEQRRVPRVAATLLVFAVLLSVVGLLGWLTLPRLVREMTTLVQALPGYAAALTARITRFLGDYPELERQLRPDEGAVSQLMAWLLGALGDVWRYGLSLLVLLVLGLVLLSVVLYMVADPRPLVRAYVGALPPGLRDPGTRAFARASRMVVGWVYSSALISGMKAVPAFFVLHYLGIPGALVWAVFTFFADLVPRLGFYLMLIPPVLIALSIDPMKALWVGLFYWGISELLGNFVAPRVQAATMALHPVFLLFVTLAMVSAFGLVGALIATPVAGFIQAYYDEFYLARVPRDPRLADRVEAILRRESLPDG
ncbi:MAG: AI-2E family transporter [Gemmatimonadota bacterium]|jgi:predicted PurR-regulated permease PerM|nr:AI-2E family transporter [Gemmatimonadota bacterium]